MYEVFGYVNEQIPITNTGLTALKRYVTFNSFPSDVAIKIINPRIITSTLAFQINVNKYYDQNGILQTTDKIFDTRIMINNLESSASLPVLKSQYNKLSPTDILGYWNYNSTDGLVDNLRIKEYINFDTFPADAVFSINNETHTSTSLTISISATTWYNANGIKQTTPKTFDPLTLNDLPAKPSTSLELRLTYDKNILTGDLATLIKYNSNDGSFDKSVIQQYVNFISIVPSATYTMKNFVTSETSISFTIIATDVYVDGLLEQNKEFNISIVDLMYKIDSIKEPFVNNNIIGNGIELSDAITKEIIVGSVITPQSSSYGLWTKLVDINTYPPETTFTILEVNKLDKYIFTNFVIKLNANSYYEGNVTVNKDQERTIDLNNLKFTPTNIVSKDVWPTDINALNCLQYIEYNSTNGAFNPVKLEEFVTLTGFDLRYPGTSTKMVNVTEDTPNNTVNFDLEVQNYVGANGIGINKPKTMKFSMNLTPKVEATEDMGIIIGISVGSSILLLLLIIIITMVIMKKKKANQLTNNLE